MTYISELLDDEIEPGITYEKIRGRISSWGKIDKGRFYNRDLKNFKDQGRVTILTKNKVVLNPIFDLKPWVTWVNEEEISSCTHRISIITVPKLSKSESIDIQE